MSVRKAKAAGISASSFFDLKAELSKQEDEFAKKKAAGLSTAIVGGVKRPNKKPTVWARQNAGVKSRGARDLELEAVSRPTLESARAALERKAKIYDKLRKGKTGGLNDKQYDALLVDFEQKAGDVYESDSDDIDESLTVPRGPVEEKDDPVVEYEDEFGRIRTAPRSEVPRNLAPTLDTDQTPDDEIIYNPVNHFPIYEPSAERVAEIVAAHSEANNPLNVHYDATREVRAKGAAYYQLSGDEETRRQQMEELKSARHQTEKVRQETGAVDMKPGEVEGMREEGTGTKSRAVEKRKRELEERRRMVDAKRKKVANGEKVSSTSAEVGTLGSSSVAVASVASDPFATLEFQSGRAGKGKNTGLTTINNDADAFLAQLERDMLSREQTN